VLLSTPLHASSNFTVSVQLANKRGLKEKFNLHDIIVLALGTIKCGCNL
jgi:hypothetical protein